MPYCWQAFGVIWIVWGLGLTVWIFSTRDTSRVTAGAFVVLALCLVLPFVAMFFGAQYFHRWTRQRLTMLPSSSLKTPLVLS